jgi:SnoaL-like domain
MLAEKLEAASKLSNRATLGSSVVYFGPDCTIWGVDVMDVERLVDHVLLKYLHAANSRDGAAAIDLFASDAVIQVYERKGETYALVDEVMGKELINYLVTTFLPFHEGHEAVRRLTTDHLVEVNGDAASVTANLFVTKMATNPAAETIGPKPASDRTTRGIVQAGLLKAMLVGAGDEWKIKSLKVFNDGTIG